MSYVIEDLSVTLTEDSININTVLSYKDDLSGRLIASRNILLSTLKSLTPAQQKTVLLNQFKSQVVDAKAEIEIEVDHKKKAALLSTEFRKLI